MQHHLARDPNRRLQPKRHRERVRPREMADAGKRETIVAVQLRRMTAFAIDDQRPFMRVARFGRLDTVGDFVRLDFIERKRGRKPRHGRFGRFALEPFRERPASGFAHRAELPLLCADLLRKLRQPRVRGRLREQQRLHRRVIHKTRVRVLARFVDVLKKREERIKIPHRDGIVLVIVAPGTFQGQSEKYRAESVHPVHHVTHAELFFHNTALFVLQMQAVERRGQALFFRRTR